MNNLLIQGDNVVAMKWLIENGYKGKIDLVYIDPPFATGGTFAIDNDGRVATISKSNDGELAYKDFENDVDFNKDKNCIMAFKIIESKLTSEDTLNKAGYEALKLNPDMIKEIASNDYDMLKEKYSKKNN